MFELDGVKKIKDFGAKIGGARKDKYTGTHSKKSAEKSKSIYDGGKYIPHPEHSKIKDWNFEIEEIKSQYDIDKIIQMHKENPCPFAPDDKAETIGAICNILSVVHRLCDLEVSLKEEIEYQRRRMTRLFSFDTLIEELPQFIPASTAFNVVASGGKTWFFDETTYSLKLMVHSYPRIVGYFDWIKYINPTWEQAKELIEQGQLLPWRTPLCYVLPYSNFMDMRKMGDTAYNILYNYMLPNKDELNIYSDNDLTALHEFGLPIKLVNVFSLWGMLTRTMNGKMPDINTRSRMPDHYDNSDPEEDAIEYMDAAKELLNSYPDEEFDDNLNTFFNKYMRRSILRIKVKFPSSKKFVDFPTLPRPKHLSTTEIIPYNHTKLNYESYKIEFKCGEIYCTGIRAKTTNEIRTIGWRTSEIRLYTYQPANCELGDRTVLSSFPLSEKDFDRLIDQLPKFDFHFSLRLLLITKGGSQTICIVANKGEKCKSIEQMVSIGEYDLYALDDKWIEILQRTYSKLSEYDSISSDIMYRKGVQWRTKDKDVNEDDFLNEFGFRGVEFGNYVTGKERHIHMNAAFDAFCDLAAMLGIPRGMVSLDGTLALAFGSRGRGGRNAACAHYEPKYQVINLTRPHGAGCLAHEWWHAFEDFVFARAVTYAFNLPFDALIFNPHNEWMKRSRKLGVFTKKNDYWCSRKEVKARCFETYFRYLLRNYNFKNNYLCSAPKASNDYYPYPIFEDENDLKKDENVSVISDFFEAVFSSSALSQFFRKEIKVNRKTKEELLKNHTEIESIIGEETDKKKGDDKTDEYEKERLRLIKEKIRVKFIIQNQKIDWANMPID